MSHGCQFVPIGRWTAQHRCQQCQGKSIWPRGQRGLSAAVFPEIIGGMLETGYILFRCNWQKAPVLLTDRISQLVAWRNRLFDLGLIGKHENGIGFGNISLRGDDKRQFIISGSQTGGIPQLEARHFTTVTDYKLSENRLSCEGPVKASSESLSHAAVYEGCKQAQAVIHVHQAMIWKMLFGNALTTDPNAPPGTPEMAYAIANLLKNEQAHKQQFFVMGGHKDGIISFGESLDSAGAVILGLFDRYNI